MSRESVEAHRLDCWTRFLAAVRAHRGGNLDHVRLYLRDIERRHDRVAAECQRTELVKYAKSSKPA